MASRLIKNPEFDGMLNALERFDQFLIISFVDIGDDITNGFIGFEVLPHDIRFVLSQYLIDFCLDTGFVFVNMQ